MLLMRHADHLKPSDPKRHARVDRGGRGQAQSKHRRKRLFSNEIAGGEKRDFGLFAFVRNDREFSPAALKIEDGVSLIPLRKECLLRLHVDKSSSKASMREKNGWVEY